MRRLVDILVQTAHFIWVAWSRDSPPSYDLIACIVVTIYWFEKGY